MSSFWWDRSRTLQAGAGGVEQPTFRVFGKAHQGRCLAVCHGALVLALTNPADERQHWFKDRRLSPCIKDKEGNPVFSLVNKATGLAVQHPLGPYYPVRLLKFNPDDYDESVLWTESGPLFRDFGRIRMMHDIYLCIDALPGDEYDGGVRDDTIITLTEWAGGDTQSWKIVYWNDDANTTLAGLEAEPTCRLYCKANVGFSITVREGTVCCAPTDPNDEYQHWIQEKRPGNRIKDQVAYPAFALINKVTGDAIKGSISYGLPVKLVPYNPFDMDVSVLLTMGQDMGHGFRCIHVVNNISLNFNAGDNNIMISHWREEDTLQWKIVPWSSVAENCESHKIKKPVSR